MSIPLAIEPQLRRRVFRVVTTFGTPCPPATCLQCMHNMLQLSYTACVLFSFFNARPMCTPDIVVTCWFWWFRHFCCHGWLFRCEGHRGLLALRQAVLLWFDSTCLDMILKGWNAANNLECMKSVAALVDVSWVLRYLSPPVPWGPSVFSGPSCCYRPWP